MGKRVLSQLGLNAQAAPLTWARIGSVAGAASDTVYVDSRGVKWRCVQWTASAAGGLTVAVPGLIDVLVVSGGSAAWNALVNGGGGRIVSGLQQFAAGAHSVVIGAGGTPSASTTPSTGKASRLGSLDTGLAAWYTGAGSSDAAYDTGITSSITGTALVYGRSAQGSPRANSGDGSLGGDGAAGAVILRVPA